MPHPPMEDGAFQVLWSPYTSRMGIIQLVRKAITDHRSPSICERLGLEHGRDEQDPWGGTWCYRCDRCYQD